MDRDEIYFMIILAIAVYFCLKIYRESDTFNLKCIVSDVDGNKYCIRERQDSKEAVDLLANTVRKMKKLILYMKKHDPDNPVTQRLVHGFNPKKCLTSDPVFN